MITYHINSEEEKKLFIARVEDAITSKNLNTECSCPLCKVGKVDIVRSSRIKGYLHALCNSCGAGAFN